MMDNYSNVQIEKLIEECSLNLKHKKKKFTIWLIIIYSFSILLSLLFLVLSRLADRTVLNYESSLNHNVIEMSDGDIYYGKILLPNNFDLVKKDDWLCLIDKDFHTIVGYQIYKGYQLDSSNDWVCYEKNPILMEYNYDSMYFRCVNIKNNCYYGKWNNYYKICFTNILNKSDDNKKYSISFFIIDGFSDDELKYIVSNYKM